MHASKSGYDLVVEKLLTAGANKGAADNVSWHSAGAGHVLDVHTVAGMIDC